MQASRAPRAIIDVAATRAPRRTARTLTAKISSIFAGVILRNGTRRTIAAL